MVIKQTKHISMNILLVVVALLGVLLLSVGSGRAWFTSNQHKGIIIIAGIGEFNMSLYQVEGSESTEVYTYKKNNQESTTKYINLSQALQPDTFVDLKLNLVNNDAGASVYLRYKLELFACGAQGDTEIPINITLGDDFIQGKEDYFNYVDASDNKKLFANANSTILLTGFKISYNDFSVFENSNTVKLVLTVECTDSADVF